MSRKPLDPVAALRLAIIAMNNTPSFDTGIVDPDNPRRRFSSYRLLPQLEAVARAAEGSGS